MFDPRLLRQLTLRIDEPSKFASKATKYQWAAEHRDPAPIFNLL